jgi:hypothetical protein
MIDDLKTGDFREAIHTAKICQEMILKIRVRMEEPTDLHDLFLGYGDSGFTTKSGFS